MPKYYVSDNLKKLTIARDNKLEAAKAFVQHYRGRGLYLGQFISVSETGFNNQIDTDSVFESDKLICAA